MKIELIFTDRDSLEEKFTGSTCFEATFDYQRDAINNCQQVYGLCIINHETYKFSFSPYFMDGDVITTSSSKDRRYYSMVKSLVVEYVYAHKEELSKNHRQADFHRGKIKELESFKIKFPNERADFDEIIKEEKECIRLLIEAI